MSTCTSERDLWALSGMSIAATSAVVASFSGLRSLASAPERGRADGRARAADQRYRDMHGRPITRDALRAALRISGLRATQLRRRLTAPAAVCLVSDAPLPVHVPDAKEAVNRP